MTATLDAPHAPAQAAGVSPIAGPMRVLTLPACDVLYVATRTTMAEMKPAIGRVIDQVSAIRDGERVLTTGGLILRYYGEEQDSFTLEAAFQLTGEPPEIVAEHTRRLPHMRCATLLVCGGLEHLPFAYETLSQEMRQAGLRTGGEGREAYYEFEGDSSPNNVTRIALEIAA